MKDIANWLYLTDQQIFLIIRRSLGSRYLEDHAALFSNLNAWMPLFVFLAIMMYLSKPKLAAYSIFFGLGTFILSFQSASILANFLLQPAPWKVEYFLHQLQTPAFGNGSEIGMPDWQIAAVVGTFHFAKLRLRAWKETNIAFLWLPVLIFSILRIYAGYTYPLGAFVATMVGLIMGWLMFQLARNLELISHQANSEQDPVSKDDGHED